MAAGRAIIAAPMIAATRWRVELCMANLPFVYLFAIIPASAERGKYGHGRNARQIAIWRRSGLRPSNPAAAFQPHARPA
jgi:hypothetical protein